MLTIKQAKESDADILSQLAYSSEAFCGYDEEHMRGFLFHYNLTPAYIRDYPVYILVKDGRIIGFWGLNQTAEGWKLEYFYIIPALIGKGYGRCLWNSLIKYCRRYGISSFTFVTGPHSVGFYQRMGAQVVGEAASLLDHDRLIPILHFNPYN